MVRTKATELIQNWVSENNFLNPGEQLQVSVTVSIAKPPTPVIVSVVLTEIENKSVDELTFSSRAKNGLYNQGITTVGMLCQRTVEDLDRYSFCGSVAVAEIRKALALECDGMALRNDTVWNGKELTDLGLDLAVERRLRNVGITSLGMLIRLSEKELRDKGVGKSFIKIITSRILWLGKSLKPK